MTDEPFAAPAGAETWAAALLDLLDEACPPDDDLPARVREPASRAGSSGRAAGGSRSSSRPATSSWTSSGSLTSAPQTAPDVLLGWDAQTC